MQTKNGCVILEMEKYWNIFFYLWKGEFVMEENKKSGLGTAGLVLGIIGVCTSFIPIINNLSLQ